MRHAKRRKSKRKLKIIGIAAAAVVALGCVGGLAYAYNARHNTEAADLPTAAVAATAEPTEIPATPSPTPAPGSGDPKTKDGLAAYLSTQEPKGSIVINEVCVSNTSTAPKAENTFCDWVEIKNISGEAVSLAGYYLSDDADNLQKWSFPDTVLEAGEVLLVYCDDDEDSEDWYYHASFNLNSEAEDLFLTMEDGTIADAVFLHDIPLNGSCGRIDGQDGYFYFTTATPREQNTEKGYRTVSEMPETLTEPGIYNNSDGVYVELSGSGTIHYTLDGSKPTEESDVYDGPIFLTETTVVRAMSVDEASDSAPSRVSTFSYIINENHTLPVLSLSVDNPGTFMNAYYNGLTVITVPANLEFYDENGQVFNAPCGVKIKGKTSLSLPKKSLGVVFDGIYGMSKLKCDVFGTGTDKYTSLNIRAGQDYTFAMIRNELVQGLADDVNSEVLTQASRYCILYLNGQYYGLYCLKEDYSKSLYAAQKGVSKSSVSYVQGPVPTTETLYSALYEACENLDMSDPDNYASATANLNMNSYIDWLIFEGWSCNSDTQGNVKFFASSETGSAYDLALYDLDWALTYYGYCFSNVFDLSDNGNGAYYMNRIAQSLSNNEEFRQAFLSRFSELISSTLSNENVLAKIDTMEAQLEPEMERECERWDHSYNNWNTRVEEMKALITDNDLAQLSIDKVCYYLNVTDAERAQYFGN